MTRRILFLLCVVIAAGIAGSDVTVATSAAQSQGVNARILDAAKVPASARHVFGLWYSLALDATTSKALAAAADVVEPNYVVTADTYLEDSLLTQVNAPMAWQTSKGAGVTIAVIDTGTDCTHPALAFHCSGDADDNGHGTHTAGIAYGLAPGASIRAYKVLGASGSGDLATIASAVTRAADDGARVENMSLGCVNCPSQMMADAVAYARSKGTVVIASAGNHGTSDPATPAQYAFAVAAVDGQDRLASFSAWGDWVDAAAPGVQILSTCMGGGYCRMSGTSMAAPVVAGIAALAISAHPLDTVPQIEARLADGDAIASAHPVGKRVNAAKAVTGGAPIATPLPPAVTPTPPPGSNKDVELVDLVNAQRAHYGLPALATDPALTRIAHAHDATMNDCAEVNGWETCFTHNVAGEPDVWARLASAGYPNYAGGENIAQGYSTPTETVEVGWMNSDGHRANILGNWTHIGCAWDDFAPPYYQGRVMTCDFGKQGGVGPSPTITPSPTPSSTAPHWDNGYRFRPFRLLDIPMSNTTAAGLVNTWAQDRSNTWNNAGPGILYRDANGQMTNGNRPWGAVTADIVGGFLWTREMDEVLTQIERATGLKAQWGTVSWQ